MVTHLAALAMLLDEDHVEELILNLCRDNDMVAMLYRRDALPGAEEGDAFDGAELFAVLNTTLWEQGRKVLEEQLARTASINRIESSRVGASVGGGSSKPFGGCGVGE